MVAALEAPGAVAGASAGSGEVRVAVAVGAAADAADAGDTAPRARAAPAPALPWRARYLPAWATAQRLRPPLQMFAALLCSCLLTCAPRSADAFENRGVWTAITVTMALEANVGATSRKATLRALGTAVGGALAALVVALVAAFNNGWAPGAPAGKVAAMALLVSAAGAGVQFARARDPARDYAYVVCLVTLVLAALSDFRTPSWRLALTAVAWRLATIAAGGAVAFLVSNTVLPEYASHAVRSTLALALDDAAALLGGIVDAYIEADDAAAAPGTPRLSLSRAARGFSGVRGADGGDAGLALAHAALHALETRLSKALDRFASLLVHAAEEKRFRLGEPLSVRHFAAAGAAARGVFTGAVALLHGMESGLHLCALCAVHADAIRAARGELAAAFAAAGRLAKGAGSVAEAHAAGARLEAAVAALAADVTTEAAWRRLLLGRAADAAEAALALRHNVQALGAVCFALGDAARQLARVVAEIDPDADAKLRPDSSSRGGGGLVAAPGGHAPAGGGAMAAALRTAAHTLDAALHSALARKHGAEAAEAAEEPHHTGSLARTHSMFPALDVLSKRRAAARGRPDAAPSGGARAGGMPHSSSAPGMAAEPPPRSRA